MSKIKIITAPDLVFDQGKKILVINPGADLKSNLEQQLKDIDETISVYLFEQPCKDIKWLLTAANISDTIIIDMDFCDERISQLFGYLLSLPDTYYRTSHPLVPWDLINTNRFYDFDSIKGII